MRNKAENKRITFTSTLPNGEKLVEDADLVLDTEGARLARSAGYARMSVAQNFVETDIRDTEINLAVNGTVIEHCFLAQNEVEISAVNKIITRTIFQRPRVQP